jgi:hypothetical protein
LFTPAHTAAMRDHTKRRNYSEEAEQFRREHAARRAWGLEQRHARKLRRLYGSTAAAWAAYRQRAEEVLSPARSALTDDEAGPPARAETDIVTPPASPIPALPEAALPEAALPEAALPEAALPAAARPETIPPGTALPVVTTFAQVEDIPVVCDASAAEVPTPEAILAETTTAEPARDHRGRTNPASDRPTPTTQTEPTTVELSAVELSAVEPLSARRTARALTTSCTPRSDHPARRSPPGPVSRCSAGEAGKSRTDRARQRGPGRRKHIPSAGIDMPHPAGNKPTRMRGKSRSRRIFQRGARQYLPTWKTTVDTNPGTADGMVFPVRGCTGNRRSVHPSARSERRTAHPGRGPTGSGVGRGGRCGGPGRGRRRGGGRRGWRPRSGRRRLAGSTGVGSTGGRRPW